MKKSLGANGQQVIRATSGQSYKHFTSVTYDPRVVIWAMF